MSILPNQCLSPSLKRYPDTQYLDAMLCDLSCVIRGKRYPIDLADKIFTDGMMLPDYFGQRYLNAYRSCKLKEYQAFTESGHSETSGHL